MQEGWVVEGCVPLRKLRRVGGFVAKVAFDLWYLAAEPVPGHAHHAGEELSDWAQGDPVAGRVVGATEEALHLKVHPKEPICVDLVSGIEHGLFEFAHRFL